MNLNANSQQIANYVKNGSFEDLYDCNTQLTVSKAKGWMCVDSSKFCAFSYNACNGGTPGTPVGYQKAKDGGGFVRLILYYTPFPPPANFARSNIKNRLKQNLQAGKTYCCKMYVSVQDDCPLGIDGFGFYFGDNTIDTIIYNARLPLTFLTPQVSNPTGNIITDTMNWTPITGTFVATGSEKYLVVANFKSEAATNTAPSNTNIPGNTFSEYFVDAISCIDIDLPAYAGPDVAFVPGGSVYIGRPQDVGIDEACMWYKLPNTTTAIDTAAGIWVSPAATSTYIVKQEICGNIKWDTVVVHQSAVGLAELEILNDKLKISPNPVTEMLNVEWEMMNEDATKNNWRIEIMNALGQVVNKDELVLRNNKASIYLTDLPNGVYLLNLKGNNSQIISKRFVIAK